MLYYKCNYNKNLKLEGDTMKRPTHPAELLREFIGDDKFIDSEKAAKLIDCHQRTIEKIMNFDPSKELNRGISQELGWKMAKAFGTDKEFWNDLQKTYDLWKEVSKNDIEPVMKFNEDDIDFINLVTRYFKKNNESPHPAKIVQQLVGEGKKYSITEAGLITGIPRKTLSDFLQYDDYKKDNVSLSSKMAIKLGKAFQMDPSEWVSLQIDYDDKNKAYEEVLGKDLMDYLKRMEKKEVSVEDEAPSIDNFVKNKSKSRRKP